MRYLILKPSVSTNSINNKLKLSDKWSRFYLYEEKITSELNANFLNYEKKLNFPSDWNDISHSKLWTYNLHYFEDFSCNLIHEKQKFYSDYLNLWIKQNPPGDGVGWEPYPTSLRISNLLKASLCGFPLSKIQIESIYMQSSFLINNLEKHLLCNHYFVNLKAIFFSGVMFGNKKWFEFASEQLIKEIDEQIMSDGEHFELSPMYHSLILVDLLDIYNLCLSYPSNEVNYLKKSLKKSIPKMLNFLDLMTHGDGGLSFFNDSVDGISPSTKLISQYAKLLSFELKSRDLNKLEINSFASGYMTIVNNQNKLIFNAANIGPNYNPGHAHADTFSFELSIKDERVFVNSGISHYNNNKDRLKQRSTMLHNTVEVDRKNSSQVWSSFRVAKRAEVIFQSHKLDGKNAILCGKHNGYKGLFKGTNHKREIILAENDLYINDFLDGSFKSAIARYHFHPDLEVSILKNIVLVKGKKFKLIGDLKKHKARIIDAHYYPEFGKVLNNKCLEIIFISNKNNINFQWSDI